ncbi:MAG TPA: twin-arginine translocase TatA/TatE family subunit [Streptosporangiaceae bacterium]|nr:twin-arginine translocase TatA/TatE family subunit [Streptosporangiaceae bacterium]
MFDPSAPHIIILLVVVLLLFGSRRLPGAARSLGQSMHIFKRSVQGMEPEDPNSAANPSGQPFSSTLPPAFPAVAPPAAAPAQDATQQQLLDLQRQVADLQRQSASSGNGQAAETQTSQPF